MIQLFSIAVTLYICYYIYNDAKKIGNPIAGAITIGLTFIFPFAPIVYWLVRSKLQKTTTLKSPEIFCPKCGKSTQSKTACPSCGNSLSIE